MNEICPICKMKNGAKAYFCHNMNPKTFQITDTAYMCSDKCLDKALAEPWLVFNMRNVKIYDPSELGL